MARRFLENSKWSSQLSILKTPKSSSQLKTQPLTPETPKKPFEKDSTFELPQTNLSQSQHIFTKEDDSMILSDQRNKTEINFNFTKPEKQSLMRSTISHTRMAAAPSRAFTNYTNKVLAAHEKLYKEERRFEEKAQRDRIAKLNKRPSGLRIDGRVTESIAMRMSNNDNIRLKKTKLPQESSLPQSHTRVYFWG